jgi:HSP20 family protein
MNINPWRKQEGDLAIRSDLEDLWRSLREPFDGFRSRLPAVFQARNVPPMNVSETEGHFTVALELPGMDSKDINIEIMGNQLQISGERKWEEEKKGKEFHRVESQYGSFARSLTLPENLRLDRESIEATFKNGILEVKVPKLEPTPTAKIPIKSK